MLQPLDIGLPGDDNSGDFLPDAMKKVNDNTAYHEMLIRRLAGVNTDAVPFIAGVGDSNTGHTHSTFSSSPFYQAAAQHYNFNAYVPTSWAFSAPGKKSDYVRQFMVAELKAKIEATGTIPIMVAVTSGQNDGIVRLDIAQGTFENVKGTVLDILALGVPYVWLWGQLPDPKLTGAGRPEALDWLNTALMRWARTIPGVHFQNVLDIVKDRSGKGETQAQPAVWWRQGVNAAGVPELTHGSQPGLNQIGGCAIDNEHPAFYFGHLTSRPLAQFLRRFLGVMPLPDLACAAYDRALNPLGNYLGTAGLYRGKGGTLNGVPSDNVPAGWAITGDFGNLGSATITPSIYVDGAGECALRLTGAGVPSGSGVVGASYSTSAGADEGNWMLFTSVRRRAMRGFSGFAMSNYQTQIGTAGGLGNILPGVADDPEPLIYRTMEPFYFKNDFSGQKISWATAFVAGVELAGSIDVSRTAQVRVG